RGIEEDKEGGQQRRVLVASDERRLLEPKPLKCSIIDCESSQSGARVLKFEHAFLHRSVQKSIRQFLRKVCRRCRFHTPPSSNPLDSSQPMIQAGVRCPNDEFFNTQKYMEA